METIYADLSVSMTEFKKNPAKIVRSADKKPVAVLSHNKPAFYMLAPALFEALLEELDDKELVEIARLRLASKDEVVMVDIEETTGKSAFAGQSAQGRLKRLLQNQTC